MSGTPADARVVVLLPVFDDWPSALQLIPRICEAAGAFGPPGIVIVDDGSVAPAPAGLAAGSGAAWVRVLTLRRNLGHQRAIAIGLSHVEEHVPCEAVVVMDADGEDRPEDLRPLLAAYQRDGGHAIVFAERTRRVERIQFRLFYLAYRLLHRLLTGRGIKVGNFSVIPRARLASLVVVSELWIHYAAAVVRSRQPWTSVPAERGRRLGGQPKMDFVALVVHGLSALSVYSDVVFTRLLMAAAGLGAAALAALAAAVSVRLFTDLAVPGWASFVVGLLLVIMLQTATFAVFLSFLVLGSRQQAPVVPARDYAMYVAGVRDVGGAQAVGP